MKRVIASNYATSADAIRIFKELKKTCPGHPTLNSCDDSAIIYTVAGIELRVNFRGMDIHDLETEIYRKAEDVLEGNYSYIYD